MEFEELNLDNLIIKDKEYYRKRRNKILIIIAIIFGIVAIAVVITILLLIKRGGKIICIYKTTKDDENINLINKADDLSFSLIIDEESFSKRKSHTFKKAGLHKVIFHFKKKFETLGYLFHKLDNLIEIDFSQLVTEKVKSLEYVLNYCRNLTKVTFDNKTPNLHNMSNMFSESYIINTFNLKLNTSKVTRMDNMFYINEKLTSLDLSFFEFDNLENAESMFGFCYSLKKINFNENTRTKNLKNIYNIFKNCSSLEHMNTQVFKENKLTDFIGIFQNCFSLKYIDISIFDLSNAISISYLFDGCFNLTSVDFSNLKNNHLLKFTDSAFSNCHKLISLNFSSFDFSSLKDASNMFQNCYELKYIELPNKSSSIIYTNYMFENCYELTSINLGFLEDVKNWSSGYGMFKNCKKLKNITVPKIHANLLKRLNEMFSGCTDLTEINLGQLKTLNIFTISRMFYHCEKLETLNLSKFDTTKVTNVAGVLEGVPRSVEIIINKNITSKIFLEEIEKLKNETI